LVTQPVVIAGRALTPTGVGVVAGTFGLRWCVVVDELDATLAVDIALVNETVAVAGGAPTGRAGAGSVAGAGPARTWRTHETSP
jgi:hypothetical protein